MVLSKSRWTNWNSAYFKWICKFGSPCFFFWEKISCSAWFNKWNRPTKIRIFLPREIIRYINKVNKGNQSHPLDNCTLSTYLDALISKLKFVTCVVEKNIRSDMIYRQWNSTDSSQYNDKTQKKKWNKHNLSHSYEIQNRDEEGNRRKSQIDLIAMGQYGPTLTL